MEQKDIIIESDLLIENGDIKISVSDEYNSLYLIYAKKGQLRVNPLLGVGVLDFINSPLRTGRELSKAIRLEHERDGYRMDSLEVTDEKGVNTLSVKATKVKI